MKREVFLPVTVLLCALAVSAAFAQEGATYDILLKGGHVIDPANNIDRDMDVAVLDGKIARVDRNIPSTESKKTVDVSGYYVTPGLIDMHIIGFYTNPGVTAGVIPDHHCIPSGVTTCVEGGSSGADTFEDFKKIVDRSRIRILAFLNIAAPGANKAEQDPAQFNVQRAVETAKKYSEIIIGLKTEHYDGRPYNEHRTPWASVDSVLKAAELAGLPVQATCVPQPPSDGYPARSYREFILKKLRPGDIVSHCMAVRYPILMDDEKINPDIFKAMKRGVKFDLAHAGHSFQYRIVVPSIKQGFIPDAISADLFGSTPTTTGISLTNVMSKFICLGIPLEDVIRRTTVNPAQIINRPELGNLSAGAPADIAVFELMHGNFSYRDTDGKITSDRKLQCVMTVFAGRIIYDHPYGLSIPLWENIPKDSRYWANTSKQRW